MTEQILEDLLKKSFFNKFFLKKRRENLYQLIVPIYHDDGDMFDMFVKYNSDDSLTICDCGLTLMRLSYNCDIDKPKNKRIFSKIVEDNGAFDEDGNISILTSPDMLFENIMQFSQIINKVLDIENEQRNISGDFYKLTKQYITSSLAKYEPKLNYSPIKDKKEFSVDYFLNTRGKPAYLFAVYNDQKALDTIVNIMTFQEKKIPFTSIIVHKNYDLLTLKTRKKIMTTADKQFPDYEDFTENIGTYLERLSVG